MTSPEQPVQEWSVLIVNDPGDDQEYITVEAATIEDAARIVRESFGGSGWAEATILGGTDPLVLALDSDEPGGTP